MTMEYEMEPCYKCGNATRGIYVRAEVDGKWGAQPICDSCYEAEYPGREPVRLIHKELANDND